MKGNIKKLTVLVIIVAIAMFFVWAMASAGDLKGKKSIRGVYAGTGGGTCIIAPGGFYTTLDRFNLTPNCTNVPVTTPPTPCTIVQWFSREADYTFENDGTGSMTGTGRVVAQTFSPLAVSTPPHAHPNAGSLPYAGSLEANFEFKYKVDDSGMVTIEQKPETYYITEWTSGPAATYPPDPPKIFRSEGWGFTGSITPDGKVMNLASGAPKILTLQQISPSPTAPPFPSPAPTEWPEYKMICNFDTVLIWQHD